MLQAALNRHLPISIFIFRSKEDIVMLKTGAQYLEEMKAMRPNIYKYGKLIEDPTTDPITAAHIKNVAMWYDRSCDPATQDLYTTTSFLTGERAHRWNTIMTKPEDLVGNMDMKRDGYRACGSCMGPCCAGWVIMNALWSVTYDMDKEYGTDYHERLKKFAMFAEEKALSLAGAITDGKGNRGAGAGAQEDPDLYLHVKEQRPDGIIISGFKTQICGTAGAQYVLCMPTTGMKPGEEAYALACAVPRDVEGLTIIEARRSSDTRAESEAEGWDGIRSGTTAAYMIFDDVFVPTEHVFMNGETKYSGKPIGQFSTIYRSCIGACVAGQGDVIIGAALGMARVNGLSAKPFQDRLNQMAIHNETTYGMGLGSIMKGKNHPSGAFYPNGLLAHANKVLVGTLPYEVKRMAVDIAGGIVETGCMPSYKDLTSPIYGEKLLSALQGAPGTKPEDRVKMARLLEWLTIGGGIPGCMHGGGSPDTGKLVVRLSTKWDQYVDYARALADVEAPLKEEKKK